MPGKWWKWMNFVLTLGTTAFAIFCVGDAMRFPTSHNWVYAAMFSVVAAFNWLAWSGMRKPVTKN